MSVRRFLGGVGARPGVLVCQAIAQVAAKDLIVYQFDRSFRAGPVTPSAVTDENHHFSINDGGGKVGTPSAIGAWKVGRVVKRATLFLVFLLGAPALAHGQSLSLRPSVSSVSPGQSFTVDVVSSDVRDLFAYQFSLSFLAGSATGSSTEGEFLTRGGSTYFIPGALASAQPTTAATLIGAIPGVSGSGTLATFTLTANSAGPLQLGLSNVILLNSSLSAIPATVSGASITAGVPVAPVTFSPKSMTFIVEQGFTSAPQTLTINAENTYPFQITASSDWVQVSPISGTLPATLSIAANASKLSSGTYGSILTISAGSAGQVYMVVSVVVQPSTQFTLLPDSVTFQYMSGAGGMPFQDVTLIAGPRSLSFTAGSDSSWLSISPAQGTTPQKVRIMVDPARLAPGNYTGRITFTAPDKNVAAKVLVVTLNVLQGAPLFTSLGVVNAASMATGPIAPGSLFSIMGANLATSSAAASTVPLPVSLAGVSVFINDIPAPLLYVSPSQINAQIPFEAGPGAASVVMVSNGLKSAPVTVTIAPVALGTFTQGQGRALALNQDGTLNTAASPAPAGSNMSVFLTGQGLLNATVATGWPAPLQTIVRCGCTVTATLGGVPAQVLFAGLAPGFVGLTQVNVQIPDIPPGDYQLVFESAGQRTNPALVAVAAR